MNATQPRNAGLATTLAALIGLGAALGLGYLALRFELPAPPPSEVGSGARLGACVMDRDGYWTGQIHGTGSLSVNWRGHELECTGDARPNGRGLRLYFAGRPAGGTDRLLLVLGIDSDITNLAGREHAASVTLVDEATSQFFHGPTRRCFARIGEVYPLPGAPDAYRVDGEFYCAGAIAAVGGDLSVTLTEMRFSGRIEIRGE